MPETTEDEVVEDTADVLPKSQFKPPPTIAPEAYGSGANKKVFFVTNEGSLRGIFSSQMR